MLTNCSLQLYPAAAVALFLRPEGRLFVGDLLYPHACIYLNLPGSSPRDFAASTAKLRRFITAQESTGEAGSALAFASAWC